MTERESLLAAAAAAPDDDTPRLVFADWCDEHGDPERAEFTRLQVELSRLDRYDPRVRQLRERERTLLEAHREDWLRRDGLVHVRHPEFRRGMVQHAVFESCERFLRETPDLFEKTPLRSVGVRDDTPAPSDEFIDSPLLERLWGLHFLRRFSNLGTLGLMFRSDTEMSRQVIAEVYADNPQREAIRQAAEQVLRADNLQRLVRSPRLARLRALDLSGTWLEEGFLSAFDDAPALANLEVLDLSDTNFREAEFAHLTQSPHLANLRGLYLRGADDVPGCHAEGVELIRQSRHLTRLRVLDLYGQTLGRAGFESLAAWPGLANIERLDLGLTGADAPDLAEGVRALAHSPYWQEIREVNLEGTLELPGHFEAFLSSPRINSLRVLRLDPAFSGEADPGEAGLQLARCPYLDGLVELDLGGWAPGRKATRLLRERFGDRLEGSAVRRSTRKGG